MTPDEALQLIDQAISQVQANREVHIKLQEATTVIGNLIQDLNSMLADKEPQENVEAEPTNKKEEA